MSTLQQGTESSALLGDRRPGWAFCLVSVLVIGLWIGLIGRELWRPDARVIFRDSNLMGLPNLQYLGESLREGFIPWLHPRRGCGMPFLADPQAQAMYPPAWAFALLPEEAAFKLQQFVHLLFLGMGFALLARFRGVNAAGSICAGIVGVSAQCNLVQIEWLPTLAGAAWVPWSMLAAMTGASGWWLLCLSMMMYSGYAYLWVMTPVIAGAGMLLAPRPERRRFLLMALLLPVVTAPCWMGYFALSGDAKPHGLTGDSMSPVTGFEPWHLSFFLMPRGIAPYEFIHADGSISSFPVESDVAWSLFCYFGVVPLILGLYAACRPTRERAAVVLMGGAGLVMAFGLGWLGNLSISLNQAIHHPATFIQLFVWALLFAWPVGWQMLDDPARVMATRTPARAWLWFGIFVAVAAAVHFRMSGLASEDAASTYWTQSFDVGWVGWLIAGATAFLAWESSRLRGAAAGLLAVALIDVFLFLPMVLPITDAAPLPARITEGIDGNTGRLRMRKDYADRYLDKEHRSRSQGDEHLKWSVSVGYPNVFSRFGISQFDVYNPPFIHESLVQWTMRLDAASGAAEVETLRTLSAVRYILSTIDMTAYGWTEIGTRVSPVGSWTARLYDAGPTPGAVVMSRSGLTELDAGRPPMQSDLVPVDLMWRDQEATAVLPAGVALPTEAVLFVPVTPWIGWRLFLDERPVSPVDRGERFGLAVSLPTGTRAVRLRFRQPWAYHALFAMLLGIVGAWSASRRKKGIFVTNG